METLGQLAGMIEEPQHLETRSDFDELQVTSTRIPVRNIQVGQERVLEGKKIIKDRSERNGL